MPRNNDDTNNPSRRPRRPTALSAVPPAARPAPTPAAAPATRQPAPAGVGVRGAVQAFNPANPFGSLQTTAPISPKK